jgi:hypothetical protein
MRFIQSLLLFAWLANQCSAQKLKDGIVFPINAARVQLSDTVYWYGVDFRMARLTDGSKMSEGELMKNKYVPGWMAELNNRYHIEYFSKKIAGKVVLFELDAVQSDYLQIDARDFVVFSDHSFPLENVGRRIESYDLPQKKGLGLVLVIENMNKPNRYVTGYFAFFDIESRRIVHALKTKGLPGSKYGFHHWWKEGFIELFGYFFGKYYRNIPNYRIVDSAVPQREQQR